MQEVLDNLIDSLNNGNILVAVVVVAVALVFNYKKIADFWDERKKTRISRLSDALKCAQVSGATRSHLESELAKEYFKITTGINLEKEFRETLIQTHRSTKGELSFVHFKRALPYLRFEDSKISVRISLFEKLGYIFNLIFGYLMVFLGLILFILPGQIKGINLVQALSIFGLGIFLIAVALFMLYQTFPVLSARLISVRLKEKSQQGRRRLPVNTARLMLLP